MRNPATIAKGPPPVCAEDEQVGTISRVQDGIDGRQVRDHHVRLGEAVRRGEGSHVALGPAPRHLPFRFERAELFLGEVRRRVELLGVDERDVRAQGSRKRGRHAAAASGCFSEVYHHDDLPRGAMRECPASSPPRRVPCISWRTRRSEEVCYAPSSVVGRAALGAPHVVG
jgi:hypothetical protein